LSFVRYKAWVLSVCLTSLQGLDCSENDFDICIERNIDGFWYLCLPSTYGCSCDISATHGPWLGISVHKSWVGFIYY
jgi:hypothetical protein